MNILRQAVHGSVVVRLSVAASNMGICQSQIENHSGPEIRDQQRLATQLVGWPSEVQPEANISSRPPERYEVLIYIDSCYDGGERHETGWLG